MAATPTQLRWRRRIEAGLRLAGPVLDLVLLVGDRLSRLVDRDDGDAAPQPIAAPAPQRHVGAGTP